MKSYNYSWGLSFKHKRKLLFIETDDQRL